MPITQFRLTFACLPPHQSAVRSVQCINSLRCCIICPRRTARRNETCFTGDCIVLSGFSLRGKTKRRYDQQKSLYIPSCHMQAMSAVSMWKPIPRSLSIEQTISFGEPQYFPLAVAMPAILPPSQTMSCKIRMQRVLETSFWNKEKSTPGSPLEDVQFTEALLRDSTLFLNFKHQSRVIPQQRLMAFFFFFFLIAGSYSVHSNSQMMGRSPTFVLEVQRKSGSQSSTTQVCLQGGLGKSSFFCPADRHIQRRGQQATDAKASVPWRNIPGVVHLVVRSGEVQSPNPVNSLLFIMQLFVAISIYKFPPLMTGHGHLLCILMFPVLCCENVIREKKTLYFSSGVFWLII